MINISTLIEDALLGKAVKSSKYAFYAINFRIWELLKSYKIAFYHKVFLNALNRQR